MAEESIDIVVFKKLVIYVKLIFDCIILEIRFFINIIIEEELCIVFCVVQKIKNVFVVRGVFFYKVMSFGSDGVLIMIGRVGGVSIFLKKENLFMINIYCMVYRLVLCSS